jgi:hypothetical protein
MSFANMKYGCFRYTKLKEFMTKKSTLQEIRKDLQAEGK